jgi:leucyl aminopeptidase (aminopeptidase T)
MGDLRQTKLAQLLVNYSTNVQKGEWVGILGNVGALPILREIYRAVLEAGGHPSLMLDDESISREFARIASEDQVNTFSSLYLTAFIKSSHMLSIPFNPSSCSHGTSECIFLSQVRYHLLMRLHCQ